MSKSGIFTLFQTNLMLRLSCWINVLTFYFCYLFYLLFSFPPKQHFPFKQSRYFLAWCEKIFAGCRLFLFFSRPLGYYRCVHCSFGGAVAFSCPPPCTPWWWMRTFPSVLETFGVPPILAFFLSLALL